MSRSDEQRVADIVDACELAHHYHRTDPDLVWMYVGEQVPALAEALRP